MAEPPPTTFAGKRLSAGDVAAALDAPVEPTHAVRRDWFDTFDWRLWRKGFVLEADRSAQSASASVELTLRTRDEHEVIWSATVAAVPRTAEELPAGPAHDELAPLLGIRALVPIASADVLTATVSVLAADGHPVAEARWEELTPVDRTGRAAGPPTTLVRAITRHGYPSAARALVGSLGDLGLAPAPHPLATACIDMTAGVDPTAFDVVLVPDLPAVEAAGAMLSNLGATLEILEPWLADPPDTEFLHDYRVALRKSRSVLKQAHGIVDDDVIGRWRPRLRSLQQRTNRMRDLDVFLLEFPEYVSTVPERFAGDLEPLHALLVEEGAREHDRLVAHLRSQAHRELVDDYRALLAAPLPHDDAPDATRPTGEVAADRISDAYRKVLKLGRRVRSDSPATALHRVRIAAKELRYLTELYGSLYEPKRLRPLVRSLKRFQDNLGEFQDCEVHAGAVEDFAESLKRSKGTSARTVMALGLLAQSFADRQVAARWEFAARFEAFSSKATAKRLAELVRP